MKSKTKTKLTNAKEQINITMNIERKKIEILGRNFIQFVI